MVIIDKIINLLKVQEEVRFYEAPVRYLSNYLYLASYALFCLDPIGTKTYLGFI